MLKSHFDSLSAMDFFKEIVCFDITTNPVKRFVE